MSYQEESYWENRYRKGGNSGPGLLSEREFLVERVKGAAQKHDVKSVLDIGIGTGELARMILDVLPRSMFLPQLVGDWSRSPDYTGVDISGSAIERAGDVIRCIECDAVESAFSPKRDMVLCFNVHYHIATDARATALVKNVLESALRVVLFLTWNERILEREPLGAHCFYRPFELPDGSPFVISNSEPLPDSPHKTLYTLTRKSDD